MLRDYTFDCLVTMPRHELEEFSARMISKMVPEDVMNELFTFDQEEVDMEFLRNRNELLKFFK